MLPELRLLGKMLLRWLGLVLFGGFFAFAAPIFKGGMTLAEAIFFRMKADLVPEGVQLIITSPLGAFLAQMNIALFAGFVFALPYLIFSLVWFISPGLLPRERRAMIRVISPSFLLFLAGCAFAYFFVVPPMFALLFAYAPRLGIVPLFSASSFISSAISFILFTGILFLLPVCMMLLARLKLVSPSFWREQWRTALLVFLVFTAVITPDGSGVTMAILALPMAMLYGLGLTLGGRPRADHANK